MTSDTSAIEQWKSIIHSAMAENSAAGDDRDGMESIVRLLYELRAQSKDTCARQDISRAFCEVMEKREFHDKNAYRAFNYLLTAVQLDREILRETIQKLYRQHLPEDPVARGYLLAIMADALNYCVFPHDLDTESAVRDACPGLWLDAFASSGYVEEACQRATELMMEGRINATDIEMRLDHWHEKIGGGIKKYVEIWADTAEMQHLESWARSKGLTLNLHSRAAGKTASKIRALLKPAVSSAPGTKHFSHEMMT